ncbi:uncharacterized protein [Elaeis guineensis]|uniref:uncharacterized protein isoform X2 n=1 Tax=Elaeis guineensis var. tenera TaxID=51953 RepID=UPI003C6D8E4B
MGLGSTIFAYEFPSPPPLIDPESAGDPARKPRRRTPHHPSRPSKRKKAAKNSERKIEMGWKAAEKIIQRWKILRGDNVMIIRGKDKGEMGVIKRVIRSQNRVIVEGKNLVKKHIKQGQGYEGGIFSIEAPLHVSNVQVLDPVTGRPCKIGYKYLEDGTKVRISRGQQASGALIPRPEILKQRRKPRPMERIWSKDTPIDLVLEKTYDAKAGIGVPDL